MGKDEGQVGKERQAEKEKEEKKEELKKEVLETVKKEREKEREEREKEEEERIEWEKREVGVQVPEEEGGDGDSGGDQKRRSRKEKADEEGIEVSIPTVAVTQIRKPYVRKGKGGKLMNLGTPRVNTAPSVENPHGTTKSQYTTHHKFQTVLQQHVSFFDADNDYIIWPSDTYNGFRRLGFNPIICLFAAIVVHAVLSYPTTPSGSEGKSLLTKIILFPFSILPDPFFRIWVDRIHKSKLEVGTGVFDTEGRFVPQHFEDIFEKYIESDTSPSTNTKQGLTLHDIFIICLTNLNIFNPVGSFMEVMHWGLVYLLLWPQDGIMRKEDIRRVYDGSLFWDVAEKKEGGGNLLGRNRVASPVNEPTGFLRGDKLGEITGMK
ncbi:Caleosin related protein-domain-containing protein [Peziza echinospora]|nr:Caleosin related protein-domain-containing protein [Peziza echinospora]